MLLILMNNLSISNNLFAKSNMFEIKPFQLDPYTKRLVYLERNLLLSKNYMDKLVNYVIK